MELVWKGERVKMPGLQHLAHFGSAVVFPLNAGTRRRHAEKANVAYTCRVFSGKPIGPNCPHAIIVLLTQHVLPQFVATAVSGLRVICERANVVCMNGWPSHLQGRPSSRDSQPSVSHWPPLASPAHTHTQTHTKKWSQHVVGIAAPNGTRRTRHCKLPAKQRSAPIGQTSTQQAASWTWAGVGMSSALSAERKVPTDWACSGKPRCGKKKLPLAPPQCHQGLRAANTGVQCTRKTETPRT